MRKIIALVLTLTAIVVLLTSCKDNGDETTEPLSTSDTSVITESTTTTAPSTTGATYVLTTNQDKQAPWYTTTRFNPSPDSATTSAQNITGSGVSNMYDDITYPTNDGGAITPSVSAVTSAAKTTEWSTIGQDGTTKGNSSTNNGTTAAAKAEGKQLITAGVWDDGEGNFCVGIDKEGWGKIKSNSMRIPIYIDGVEAEKPGTLQISSSVDGGGNQYVFVDVSKYDELEFGAEISFEIPEGFLKNTSGTKYNYACHISSSEG